MISINRTGDGLRSGLFSHCVGKVNDSLIDYVDDLHEDIEDKAQRKERKELLSLIGNCSVFFDLDEDDEDENIE